MAKLPEKLVQAPAFDSPLRRTSSTELTLIEEAEATADMEAPGPAQGNGPPTPEAVPVPVETEQLAYRVTVRLSQRQWEAVQTECYQQRMLGKKTNAASLLRDIVDSWAAER